MGALVLTAAVVAVGAVIQSSTGFGFALFVVPVLAVAVGPKEAVVTMSVIGVPLSIANAIRWRADVDGRAALTVTLAAVATMPLGLWLLATAGDRTLTAIVGAVVVGLTLWLWRGLSLPPGLRTELAAGAVSGVLATGTGTSGPPLVIAFQAVGMEAATFRATLAATFAIQSVVALGGFWARGLVTASSGRLTLAGLPAMALGALAGDRIFARMDGARFRAAVLVLLAASGMLALTEALLR